MIRLNFETKGSGNDCCQACGLLVCGQEYTIDYYKSSWGREFELQQFKWKAGETFNMTCTTGRSSHGVHPFFRINSDSGHILSVLVAWSGTWYVEIDGHGTIEVGLPDIRVLPKKYDDTHTQDEIQTKDGQAGCFKFPAVYIFQAWDGDWDCLTQKLHDYGRSYLYPEAGELPVEWNHWWTFEDALINENVFLENAAAAKAMGVELCTLDAGWYGRPGNIHWSRQQGDWAMVNEQRFPHGLAYISKKLHEMNMKFGLWMEPEAIGQDSRLIGSHPEFEAVSEGKHYENPYICLGNDSAAQWLFQMLCKMIETSGCDWMKLDFNMDPGAGCSRMDHNHHEKDGLFWHYQGYYDILNKIKNKYPQLTLENCASGGLRCDIGLLSCVNQTFLSDVDETGHSLNSFYELSRFIPPEHILHWAWSQTRTYDDGSQAFPGFEIREDTPQDLIRYTIRAAMPHALGFSRDFASMSERNRDIFRQEIHYYKTVVRPVIRRARLFHLQNARGCMVLQYAGMDGHAEGRQLLFVFCMRDFCEKQVIVKPKALDPARTYRIVDRDGIFNGQSSGKALMETGFLVSSGPQRAWIFELIEEDETMSKKYKGVIFDLDGVICFTDHYHYLAWKTVADKLGIYFDEVINNRLRGVSRMESLEIILEKYDKPLTQDEKVALAEEKNGVYKELLKNMSPADLSSEVKETLDGLRAKGLKLAIGSSSKNTQFILERIGLKGYFDAVSDGNNITNSKPDPEVFIKAAQFIGENPEDCLVVEDAYAGVDGACAGGFDSAAIGDASSYEKATYSMKTFGDLMGICE